MASPASASTPYASRPPSLSLFGGGGGLELNEAAVADFLLQKKYHLAALELHQEVRVSRPQSRSRSRGMCACRLCAAPRLASAPTFFPCAPPTSQLLESNNGVHNVAALNRFFSDGALYDSLCAATQVRLAPRACAHTCVRSFPPPFSPLRPACRSARPTRRARTG